MRLTDAERREVALFIHDVWRRERQVRRRRPSPDEIIAATYAAAIALVNAEVGNAFLYLGAPRRLRSVLQGVSADGARYSRQLTDTAAIAIEYLDTAGDSPTAKPGSVEKDRRIIALAARDLHREGSFSDTAIGREVGLSHTSVRDRRIARSMRIMQRLHADAPSIWDSKGRPVAESLAGGEALALAA